MYYLNDKHSEYEYCLYTRVGSACPYITELHSVSNLDDIMRRVEQIEKRHNHYAQIFYIDNDFYNNKYSFNQNGTYYKFLRRKVFDWEEFDSNEDIYNDKQIYYDNIIYLKNYRKF